MEKEIRRVRLSAARQARRYYAKDNFVYGPNAAQGITHQVAECRTKATADLVADMLEDVERVPAVNADLLAAADALANEVSAMLGIIEPEMRAGAGHTNVACLRGRLEQTKAAIKAARGANDE